MRLPSYPGAPRPKEAEKRTEPARENQLVWLAGGDMWLYGRMVIDGGTQRSLGTIEGNAKSPVAVIRGQQIMTMAPAGRGMGLLRATIVGTTTPSTPAATEPENP